MNDYKCHATIKLQANLMEQLDTEKQTLFRFKLQKQKNEIYKMKMILHNFIQVIEKRSLHA